MSDTIDIFDNNSLNVEVSERGLTVDRIFNETLSLPFSYFDIKVKPNELATKADVLNASLNKLYTNYLYLITNAKISSNNIPNSYTGFIGSSSADLDFYSPNDYFSLSGSFTNILSGVVDGFFATNQDLPDTYNGFFATSTELIFLSARGTDFVTLLNKSPDVDAFSNLTFNNIKSVGIDSQSNYFVLDNNVIYKYNVESILRNDTVLRQNGVFGRYLTKMMGGSATVYDQNKFDNATNMVIDGNDNVYVLDKSSVNSDVAVKKYDVDLNHLNTFNLTNELAEHPPRNITIHDGSAYVLSTSASVVQFDLNFTVLSTYELTDIESGLYPDTEDYKKMIFSVENPEIFYLMSNRNVFKKFRTKCENQIGRFLLDQKAIGAGTDYAGTPAGNEFSFMTLRALSGSDELFVGNSNASIFYRFVEDSNFQDIVYPEYQTQTLSFSSVAVVGEEFVNNINVNKAVHKLLHNHLILKDNIRAKFAGEYDSLGNLLFKGIKYVNYDDEDVITYLADLNNYIGINELVTNSTVNRVLENIYELQLDLLDILFEKELNTFPLTGTAVSI